MKKHQNKLAGCGLFILALSVVILCYNRSLGADKNKSLKLNNSNHIENIRDDYPSWIKAGIYEFGIKDPEGKEFVWATSKPGLKNIEQIVSKYPHVMVEGIKFYNVSSWADTSRLLKASYADRDKMIWSLYGEISQLKSRVINLELELSKLKKADKGK